ncbi:hypothetical protein TR75_04535 [Hydrogenibacillus schlegelii]|uniref:SLH domain-containing protein n=1 Tax=Hydrogenibacillus schlegelii TaxID=1484 RepID=A0A132NAD0_HYDSH|nr:hypothetical protein TR75_04535 [Hydrogenibacillus schlegelii]OAR04957.1 hypothetical protein SA87_10185 [Hydrogenibacillus schlegelii]
MMQRIRILFIAGLLGALAAGPAGIFFAMPQALADAAEPPAAPAAFSVSAAKVSGDEGSPPDPSGAAEVPPTKDVLAARGEAPAPEDLIPGEWIVAWRTPPAPGPVPGAPYAVVDVDPESGIGRIRALPGREGDVVSALETDANVVRYQPNGRVRVSGAGAALPQGPASVPPAIEASALSAFHASALSALHTAALSAQWYLERLRVPEAQRIADGRGVTIAVVDTGVALDHPAFRGRLESGVNLLTGGAPYDDNGHGTALAGILVGGGRLQGIAPAAKVLPIKALDAFGSGNSYTVARGIREAVDRGAKVIVLSLTDPVYSFAMENALEEAERAGVVVVAAAGNDGGKVPYPAAYPTVLGVGALDERDRPAPFSNRGDAVDVVAYGVNIFTARPGGYDAYSGTSMAAPQAAGVAALLISKKPGPAEAVRDQLRTTASPIPGAPRPSVGFGRVDAYAALSTWQGGPVTPYGGNTAPDRAAPLPLDKTVGIAVPPGGSVYFALDAPYAGSVSLTASGLSVPLTVATVDAKGQAQKTMRLAEGGSTSVAVPKGRTVLRLTNGDKAAARFTLRASFTIYTAPYGDNGSPARAYPIDLFERTGLVGTLPRAGDEAWFRLEFPEDGRLTVRAETNDPALDLVLMLQDDRATRVIDDNGPYNGRLDEEAEVPVKGGSVLKVGVRNFYRAGVNAEYRLSFDYRPAATVAAARPDTLPKSRALFFGKPAFGVVPRADRAEHYHVYLDRPGFVRVDVRGFPPGTGGALEALDGKGGLIERVRLPAGPDERRLTHVFMLPAGLSYLRLTAERPFTDRFYVLRATAADGPFVDMASHWAREALSALKARGAVAGYPDGTFRPDRSITRAEFVALLAGRLGLPAARAPLPTFVDLPAGHWAADALRRAAAAGWLSGYPDGGIRPDRPITRAEMAAILRQALRTSPVPGLDPDVTTDAAAEAFRDVPPTHWALPALSLFVEAKRMSGYPDGTLRPDGTATRAEAAAMMAKLWP